MADALFSTDELTSMLSSSQEEAQEELNKVPINTSTLSERIEEMRLKNEIVDDEDIGIGDADVTDLIPETPANFLNRVDQGVHLKGSD